MGEQYLQFEKQWGGGPGGVSQRFAGGSPYDIARASGDLSQLDEDSREKIAKDAVKFQDSVNDELDADTPGLPSLKRARGGNVAQQEADRYLRQDIGGNGISPGIMPDYNETPTNGPNNDPDSTYVQARGSNDYREVTRRKRARGGKTEDFRSPAYLRALDRQARYAKGGATKITPAWQDRPPHITQRLKVGSGSPRIHVPHEGGLVLNIHLGRVGEHAISFGHENYSGGVDASRMVQRQASHALHADARPTPFPVMHAPQVAAAAPNTFGGLLGQMPYSGGPQPTIPTPRPMMQRPMMQRPQGMSAWKGEGIKTLARMPYGPEGAPSATPSSVASGIGPS
jgi:hypothetical protein